MATEQQLIDGIKRADAAGDSDGVRVLGQHLLSMRNAAHAAPAPETSAVKHGVISLANGISANFLDRAAAGIGAVVPGMGQNQASIWNGHSLSDAYDLNRQQIEGYHQTENAAHPIASLAEIPGAMAVTAATGGAGLAADLGYGAAYGAGSSKDLRNVKDVAGNVGKQVALAGAGNLGGRLVAKGAGKAIAGIKRTEVAQRLADRGIMPTIGQSLGGGWKAFEDRLSGMPIVGESIRTLRRGQFTQMLKSAANEVLEPLGIKAPNAGTGREIYASTKSIADKAYGDALSQINGPVDTVLTDGLQHAAQRPLAKPQREAFDDIMSNEVMPRLQSGHLDGENVQALKEVLDDQIKSLSRQPGHRGTTNSLKEVRDHLMSFVERNSPDGGKGYQAARQTYGRAKTLAKAVEASNTDGIPTANQLVTAVRQGARFNKGDAYARGTAPMQGLANDAAAVLPSSIPDPGTAGQMGFLNLLAHPVRNTPGVIGGVAASIPYSKAGNTAVQSLLFRRPDFVRKIGQKAGQLATPLGMIGGSYAATRR